MRSGKNKKISVALICGGLSGERNVSVKSAENILRYIPKQKYDVQMVEITKNGQWLLKRSKHFSQRLHNKKIAKKSVSLTSEAMFTPKEMQHHFSVAFLATHGKFGEDGRLQSLLEFLGIPYTGSGVLASALGMDKAKLREFIGKINVKFPIFLEIQERPTSVKKVNAWVEEHISYPCVVKPNESGSSLGISIVDTVQSLPNAIQKAEKEDRRILVEEYITGREITCAVIGNSNQTKLIALPLVEVIPKARFFDYRSKYIASQSEEICPAKISIQLTKKIQNIAKQVHLFIGCDGLTRSDFIVSKKGEIYFLEINTIPGMTEESLCPKEAKVAGMSFGQFLDMQLELALKRASA